jgi:MFS family permease
MHSLFLPPASQLIAAYSIDISANPDFFWVFITRIFYYMGISLQAFVLFMLRDVQQVDDPKRFASLLAMISQLSAAIIATPAGHLSDRFGRKPLVYASCILMALVYVGFALMPKVDLVLWLGVGYGLGNGMFLSVDYALACDTLPSLESAAQGMGVWGVAAFLGSTVGPLIAAPLLAYFGWTSSPDRYSSTGYMAVNLAGAVYVCCSGLFLCFVRAR